MVLQSTEGFSAQLVLLQFFRITMTTRSCLQHMLLSNAPLGALHCQAEDHLCRSSCSAVILSCGGPVRFKSQIMKHL